MNNSLTKKRTVKNIVKKVCARKPHLGELMQLLTGGQIMAMEITNFLCPLSCAMLVEALTSYSMDESYLSGKARKLMESQHNRQNEKAVYFEGAQHPLLKHPMMVHALKQIMDLLSKSGKKTEIAFDDNLKKRYCPVIIREFFATLKLHNDLGAREGRGWNPIERIKRQWAFVLKLSQCEGGQTRWYPRQWQPEDERYFNSEDNYSYDEQVRMGYPEVIFEGKMGSLIIFDCTCYHAVEPVINGRRFTMGGFVGHLEEEDKLIVWS